MISSPFTPLLCSCMVLIATLGRTRALPSVPRSTGVDYTSSGNINYDNNWSLVSPFISVLRVMSPQHPGWLVSTVAAQWLYLSDSGQNAGYYTYRTQFKSICGGIGQMEFAADDYVSSIIVNSATVYTNPTNNGQYGSLVGPITFPSIPGVNTIDVIVYNGISYSGLIVYFNDYGEYACNPPTIEPTSTPSIVPTVTPTIMPSIKPTLAPSIMPSIVPTVIPTNIPTLSPTSKPTVIPTKIPTRLPTCRSNLRHTSKPTVSRKGNNPPHPLCPSEDDSDENDEDENKSHSGGSGSSENDEEDRR